MIIGVIAVAVVEPPVVDIIHVSAVLHHGVFFPGMAVGVIIGGDAGDQLFIRRIGRRHFERVFINMAAMGIMQVAVVEVIDMTPMIERGMAATSAVRVGFMPGMDHLMGAQRACQQRRCQQRNQKSSHGQSPPSYRSRLAVTTLRRVCL